MTQVTPVPMLRLTNAPQGVRSDGVREDFTATEAPLEIRVEGRSLAVVMRTPGHDRELAAGFLLSEGLIDGPGGLFEISVCPAADPGGGVVEVMLRHPETADFEALTRHVFTSSSCGVCGKASIAAAMKTHPPLPVPDAPVMEAAVLFSLPDRLRAAQPAFAETGGIHASALFDFSGRLLMVREDAGRHNALDKVTGAALLGDLLPLDRCVLLLSGRTSYELVQKALAARIPVVAAVGAPSSLAVQLAEASGITLCGFLRSGRCNVYTHPVRLAVP